MEKNIVPQSYGVSQESREKLNGHKGMLVFFTGLSGSGKSTLANILEERLHRNGVHTFVLDGDNMRYGINKDLSFDPEARKENIRRIAEISKLFVNAGIVVIAAFVAPYDADRRNIRNTIPQGRYTEVFVNTSLEECEKRDVKGLYAKARSGEIKNFTGISAPYEAPTNPDIEVSEFLTKEEAVQVIYDHISVKL